MIDSLQARMEAAAAALDFEEARRLRDRHSRKRVEPPSGWTPPVKPDLMTTGQARDVDGRKHAIGYAIKRGSYMEQTVNEFVPAKAIAILL
jgi:hypothetical protein